MQKTTRLTTRNLFDEIFATIPPDVVLYTGPSSLRERLALLDARQANTEEREPQEEEGFVEEGDSANLATTSQGASTNYGLVDLGALAHQTETVSTAPSAPITLDVQLDTDDAAVQEATKYAAVVDDIFANEAMEVIKGVEKEGTATPHTNARGDANLDTTGTSGTRLMKQRTGNAGAGSSKANLLLTAEEQIAIMRPEDEGRHEGRCVLFRPNKGFGFITPTVGGPDVYFTRDSVDYYFTRRVMDAYRGESTMTTTEHTARSRRPRRGETHTHGSATNPTNTSNPMKDDADHTNKGATAAVDDDDGATREMEVKSSNTETKRTTREGAEEEVTAEDVSEPREDLVRRAAALLTPQSAQLLESFLDIGRSCVVVPETVSFAVRWNCSGGRSSSRRLRAESIRGLPESGYALLIEQAWFDGVFMKRGKRGTSVADVDMDEEGGEKGKKGTCLSRHQGVVRTYDPDEMRGHIRPEKSTSQDVTFTADAILWDASMDPSQCRPGEGLLVRYCLGGNDKSGRPIATLITASNDAPLGESNAVWVTPTAESHDGTRRGAGGGGRGGREEAMTGRKREREEEVLLLEDDGGYGVV